MKIYQYSKVVKILFISVQLLQTITKITQVQSNEILTKTKGGTCDTVQESTTEENYLGSSASILDDETFHFKAKDVIFQEIELSQYQHQKPFGRFLDAGSGEHSLSFIHAIASSKSDMNHLGVTDWTCVTADKNMKRKVQKLSEKMNMEQYSLEAQISGNGGCNGIIIGNWEDDALCKGELFDTILVDYLVGALDFYAPYYQYDIFDRLERHLKPGGRMYVVGMQPIKERGTDDNNIIARMKQIRDGIIIMAGFRCYREYPLSWTTKTLEKSNLRVLKSVTFKITYSKKMILAQLSVGRKYLRYILSKGLVAELEKSLKKLEDEVNTIFKDARHVIESGFNYLVIAEKNT